MIIRVALAAALALSLLAGPSPADAQPAGKVQRIGYLSGGSSTVSSRPVEAFRQGLRGLGWVEGQNIVIEYRFAEGRYDRLPELAADLVRLKVDVITVVGTAASPRPQATKGIAPLQSRSAMIGGRRRPQDMSSQAIA